MTEFYWRDFLRKVILKIFDLCFILFIIAPACIFSWRGTWILMDLYLLSSNPKYSFWISCTAGLSYVICCHFLQDMLNQGRLKLRKFKIIYIFITRFYYYLAGIFAINIWRGVWGLLDTYLGKGIEKAAVSTSIALLVLVLFRGIKNLAFPPGFLSLDWKEKPFDVFNTRFSMQEGGTTFFDDLKHVGDVLISYLLLIPAAVTIWRGGWETVDELLDPDNPKMTGIISACYGYLMFLLVYIVNPYVQRAAHKLSGFWLLRLLFLQFYAFINFTAINSMWRGVWYLLDSFVFPDQPLSRAVTAHVVGFGVLFIIGASRSAGEVVFSIDGVEDSDLVVYLPHLRKVCSTDRYSLVSTKESSEEATQTDDNDEDLNSNTNQSTNLNIGNDHQKQVANNLANHPIQCV